MMKIVNINEENHVFQKTFLNAIFRKNVSYDHIKLQKTRALLCLENKILKKKQRAGVKLIPTQHFQG